MVNKRLLRRWTHTYLFSDFKMKITNIIFSFKAFFQQFQPSPEEARISYSLEEGLLGVLLADNDDDDDVDDILDTLENHPLCVDPLRYFRHSFNTLRRFCEGCWPFQNGNYD